MSFWTLALCRVQPVSGRGGFCWTPAALRRLRLRECREASMVSSAELPGTHRKGEGAPWRRAVTLAEADPALDHTDRAWLPSDAPGCSGLWPAPSLVDSGFFWGSLPLAPRTSGLFLWTKVQMGWLVFLKHSPAFEAVITPPSFYNFNWRTNCFTSNSFLLSTYYIPLVISTRVWEDSWEGWEMKHTCPGNLLYWEAYRCFPAL